MILVGEKKGGKKIECVNERKKGRKCDQKKKEFKTMENRQINVAPMPSTGGGGGVSRQP